MSEPRRIVGSAPRILSEGEVRSMVKDFRRNRTAAVVSDFKFRPGFIYTQVRAISARVNQNYDAWPSSELKKSYLTFLGKPIFVNHHNEDPRKARGRVIASRYVEAGADKYIDVIQETDGTRFPKLGHELIHGGMDSVSMGVEAGFTICSVCENRATDVFDMCGHIKFHKGEHMRNQKTGERTLVYEKCHKLGFFELSYVFDPADETAVVSRVIAASRGADVIEVPTYSEHHGSQKEAASFLHQEVQPGDVYRVRARVARDQGPTQGSLRKLLPEGKSEGSFGRGSSSFQTSARSGNAEHPSGGQYVRPSQFGVRGDQITAGTGEKKGRLAVGTQGRHGGTTRQETGSWRGSSSQKSHSSRQSSGESGTLAGLATSRSTSPGFDRLAGDLPQESRRGGLGENRRVVAFGETAVPEDVDTLRNEGDDDDSDDTFHSWITSPAELQDPDTDRAKQLDRHQEDQGLDGDRRVEDMEDFGAQAAQDPRDRYEDEEDPDQPAMPINPPGTKRGRRTSNRGASMARYYAAEDEGQFPPDDGGYPDDGGGQDEGDYEDGGSDEGGDPSQEDPDALVAEAESDLAQYDQEQGSGDDGGGDYSDAPADDGYDDGVDDAGGDEDDGSDSDYGPPPSDDGGGEDLPPWLQGENREGRRRSARPVKKRSGRGNRRAVAAQGGGMARQSLATRQRTAQQNGNQPRRHFQADDSGHTDGGPYGVDDSQGAQEDIFISQVPGSEAVETAEGEPISNTENNLVARRQAQQGQFDPNHYQRLADVIAAMPAAERKAMALKMARQFKTDNPRFNELTFYKAAHVALVRQGNRILFAEDVTSPDKVDPSLPDSGASDLKGSDFESLALDDVETQPKDASIHAFRAFDKWLEQKTGRTARQHGNGNFIRNAAVSYAKAHRNPTAALQSLFPTLEYVLVQARKNEGREATMNRYADESLDLAAPGGRIDVEAPVKNVTDADAQSSQFDLGDFGGNASDNLADPVLDAVDGNAGTWAPDKAKESSTRLASGVEAIRCAEAHIAAMPNTYKMDDRWKLTARFETMRQAVVRDRTRLCEQMIQDQRIASRRTARTVTAGASRGTNGLPQGLGRRTAAAGSRREASVASPDSDSLLFF